MNDFASTLALLFLFHNNLKLVTSNHSQTPDSFYCRIKPAILVRGKANDNPLICNHVLISYVHIEEGLFTDRLVFNLCVCHFKYVKTKKRKYEKEAILNFPSTRHS